MHGCPIKQAVLLIIQVVQLTTLDQYVYMSDASQTLNIIDFRKMFCSPNTWNLAWEPTYTSLVLWIVGSTAEARFNKGCWVAAVTTGGWFGVGVAAPVWELITVETDCQVETPGCVQVANFD